MTKLFVGVDVGSASVRAGIYTMEGTRLAFSVRPIQQFHYQTNRVEQSSSDIWQQVCTTVREAISLAGAQSQQVVSIGFDATCSLVAVGERGQPVAVGEEGDADHDIVMWMDHRAGEETQRINATNDSALQYVGGQVSIEMELPKILWLKNHFPERYAAIWRFFDLADYLVWRATGVDAAGVCTLTCKWNYLAHEERFSQSLLESVELADLVNKIPPSIIQVGQPVGTLRTDVAAQLGLTPDVVVASGLIDAHAGGLALVAAAPEANLAIISGTSNCHMIVSKEAKSVPGVWGPYFAAMYPGWWLNEGGQSAAGALVDWALTQSDAWPALKNEADALGCRVYQILNQWVAQLEAAEKYPTSQLHILADHHGNRSPRSDANARGMIAGLTLEKGPSQLARLYLATLQAIAYGTRHIIDTMEHNGQRIDSITLCGGASKNPLWLREYANVTGRAIHLVEEEDAVTLGAALNGAVACKAFSSFSTAASAMVRRDKTIEPDAAHRAFHDAKYQVYLQMYQDQQRYQAVMQKTLVAS
ncbi:Ribulokinase [Buttiauxella agrestis]|uniref:Ribulokinase n=1 Tax=Buttiauxella agrestis TaxID=82977 RepID=A0A381CD59_9ENTR|nr:FGGY-family carbohydrate kinase [Buttiauxella agrestis]SUW65796.1 Ribulokinase [Buttiauxella agrestis]